MLKRIVEKMYAVLGAIAGFLFLSLFALNIVRIALRYFAGISWIWLPDFSRLLFIWLVFIGASILVGQHEHLIMDFLVSKMKPAPRRILNLFIQFCQIAFFVVMIVGGIPVTKVRMRVPFDTWDFPTGWAYLAVPVCAVIMIIFSLHSIQQLLSKKGDAQ
jgi:TRAP-type C4-dicarboxylate transport system permease small subunit